MFVPVQSFSPENIKNVKKLNSDIITNSEILDLLKAGKSQKRFVLIKRKSKGAPKATWALSRISKIHPGKGQVTVVEIKTLNISNIEGVQILTPAKKGGVK